MEDASQTEDLSQPNGTKEKTLIFLHTYKTGGTTLQGIMQRLFPRDAIYVFPGGDSQEEVQENAESLKRLSQKGKPRIRFIWGAPFFGLHEYLSQPSINFTLLRNPVERVISEYYHVARGGPIGDELYARNISLEDYVRNPTMLSWNAQVSLLKGAPEGPWPLHGPISPSAEDLEKAKANLRQNFIIGLTERFDESLVLLKRTLGWRTIDILYLRRYVGRNRPPRDEISPETIELIEEHNKLDIELYQFAQQMFEEQISQQGSSFQREVRTFRLLNKFYGVFVIRALVLLLALLRGKLRISDFSHIVYAYLNSKLRGGLDSLRAKISRGKATTKKKS